METLGFAQVLQFVLSGLTVGSIYGLVALGFTLIFNATGIINFAQGQFVMLGGLLATTFSSTLGWPLAPAVVAAIVLTAGFGAVMEVLAIRPLRHAAVFTKIMITLAVATIVEAGALLFWGHDPLFLWGQWLAAGPGRGDALGLYPGQDTLGGNLVQNGFARSNSLD